MLAFGVLPMLVVEHYDVNLRLTAIRVSKIAIAVSYFFAMYDIGHSILFLAEVQWINSESSFDEWYKRYDLWYTFLLYPSLLLVVLTTLCLLPLVARKVWSTCVTPERIVPKKQDLNDEENAFPAREFEL